MIVSTLNEIAANYVRLAAKVDASKRAATSEAERLNALTQLVEACDQMIESAKKPRVVTEQLGDVEQM